MSVRTATGATWEGVHQALTREPGDLPAWVAQCLGPGKGRGTEDSVERRPGGGAASVPGSRALRRLRRRCRSIARACRQAPPSLRACRGPPMLKFATISLLTLAIATRLEGHTS